MAAMDVRFADFRDVTRCLLKGDSEASLGVPSPAEAHARADRGGRREPPSRAARGSPSWFRQQQPSRSSRRLSGRPRCSSYGGSGRSMSRVRRAPARIRDTRASSLGAKFHRRVTRSAARLPAEPVDRQRAALAQQLVFEAGERCGHDVAMMQLGPRFRPRRARAGGCVRCPRRTAPGRCAERKALRSLGE